MLWVRVAFMGTEAAFNQWCWGKHRGNVLYYFSTSRFRSAPALFLQKGNRKPTGNQAFDSKEPDNVVPGAEQQEMVSGH